VAVEAEIEALVGEAAEKLEQSGRVYELRWPETHGRTAAENYVGNSLHRRVRR
jgi:hypothetical protein